MASGLWEAGDDGFAGAQGKHGYSRGMVVFSSPARLRCAAVLGDMPSGRLVSNRQCPPTADNNSAVTACACEKGKKMLVCGGSGSRGCGVLFGFWSHLYQTNQLWCTD